MRRRPVATGLVLALALTTAPAGAEQAMRLLDLGGREAQVQPIPGETLFLHFWAIWCHSCVEELPALERVARECSDGPARVLAVNTGDSQDELTRFLAEHGIELPMLRDPKGRVWREVSGEELPVNLVWSDRERRVEAGPRDESQWRGALAAAGCRFASPQD